MCCLRGFHRIRHYGLLANHVRAKQLTTTASTTQPITPPITMCQRHPLAEDELYPPATYTCPGLRCAHDHYRNLRKTKTTGATGLRMIDFLLTGHVLGRLRTGSASLLPKAGQSTKQQPSGVIKTAAQPPANGSNQDAGLTQTSPRPEPIKQILFKSP